MAFIGCDKGEAAGEERFPDRPENWQKDSSCLMQNGALDIWSDGIHEMITTLCQEWPRLHLECWPRVKIFLRHCCHRSHRHKLQRHSSSFLGMHFHMRRILLSTVFAKEARIILSVLQLRFKPMWDVHYSLLPVFHDLAPCPAEQSWWSDPPPTWNILWSALLAPFAADRMGSKIKYVV